MPKNQKTPPLAVNAEKSIGQEFHDLLVATDIPIKTYTALNRTKEKFLAGKHISTKSEIACTQSMLETINQIPTLRNAVEQDPNSKLYTFMHDFCELNEDDTVAATELDSLSNQINSSTTTASTATQPNRWKYLSPLCFGFIFLLCSLLFRLSFLENEEAYVVDACIASILSKVSFLISFYLFLFSGLFWASIKVKGDDYLTLGRMAIGTIIVLALMILAVYVDSVVALHSMYHWLEFLAFVFVVFWFFGPVHFVRRIRSELAEQQI